MRQTTAVLRYVAVAICLALILPTSEAKTVHKTQVVGEIQLPPSRLVLNVKSSRRTPPTLLAIRGGDEKDSQQNAIKQNDASPPDQSLKNVQLSSFLITISIIITTFSPAPVLISKMGTERATSTLSALTASAALMEIFFSSSLGKILDATGRKPAFVMVVLAMAISSGFVMLNQSIIALCASKFISAFCMGLIFQTITQVIICDVAASNPERMGSALGLQAAVVSGSFILGSIVAGHLSNFGLSVIYGTSSIMLFTTAMLIGVGVPETLPPSKRVPFEPHAMRKQILQAPISCTTILFRHGKKVRMLAILLMLQFLPIFMGDLLQIYASTEWNLDTQDFSRFIAFTSTLGIFANASSSAFIQKIGNKRFTSIAILSSLCYQIGVSFFSFRGALICAIVGFIGTSQLIGVMAALASEGAKSGVMQGELAGERASLTALIKAISPILYSTMYIQGKKLFGLKNLPFLFNICLAVAAFFISQIHLS